MRRGDIETFVKTLTGTQTSICCPADTSIETYKTLIQDKIGMPPDQQRLIFEGLQLGDGELLSACGIEHGSVVHLVLRLRGGMYHPTSSKDDFETQQERAKLELQVVDCEAEGAVRTHMVLVSRLDSIATLHSKVAEAYARGVAASEAPDATSPLEDCSAAAAVVWQCETDSGCEPYSEELSAQIEAAYAAGERSFAFSRMEEHEYELNFAAMTQTRGNGYGTVRRVVRVVEADVDEAEPRQQARRAKKAAKKAAKREEAARLRARLAALEADDSSEDDGDELH